MVVVKTLNEFLNNFDPDQGKYSIIGVIGSGKTTTALKLIDELELQGHKVNYSCPFRELRDFVRTFIGEKRSRTYHGYGFQSILINMMKDYYVLTPNDYKKFFSHLRINYNPKIVYSETILGNQILVAKDAFIHYSLKHPLEDPKEFHKFCKTRGYKFREGRVYYSFNKVLRVLELLEKFKERLNAIEFIDMLLIPVKEGYQANFDFIGIFDEFQTATPLIIEFINKVLNPKVKIYVYDLNQFTSYPFGGDLEKIAEEVKDSDLFLLLEKSYRVPKPVGEILNTLRKKFKLDVDVVEYEPIFEKDGIVKNVPRLPKFSMLINYIIKYVLYALNQGKDVLIQVRGHRTRRRIVSEFLRLGVPFRTVETKFIKEDVFELYNAIVKLMKGIQLTESEYYLLLRHARPESFEEFRKILSEFKFKPRQLSLNQIKQLIHLTNQEKKDLSGLVQLFRHEILIPKKNGKFIIPTILTMSSALGLTASVNIVIENEKYLRDKALFSNKLMYDSELRLLYTAIGRTDEMLVRIRYYPA